MKPNNQQKSSASFLYGLGIAQIIAGIPIAMVGTVAIVVGFLTFRYSGALYCVLQMMMIPVSTGGFFLIFNGVRNCNFVQNYRKISSAMAFKNREKVTDLALVTGQDTTSLIRDLRAMSDKGYFPQSSVDLARCEFVLSGGAIPAPALNNGDVVLKESERVSLKPLFAFPYALISYFIIMPYRSVFDFMIVGAIGLILCWLAFRIMPKVHIISEIKYKAPPPPAPVQIATGNDALDTLLNAAMDHVGDLNELSLSITNEKMTAPIKELLEVSRQIFAFVERHPEKVKQTRQFMNYYLPTTIKLLQSYRELSRETQKGEAVLETLAKIEASMSEIVSTFKRELDNLYRDKTEDIVIDVDVMLAIMRQQANNTEFVNFDQ